MNMMKKIALVFALLLPLCAAAAPAPSPAAAADDGNAAAGKDSLVVSLLTCDPFDAVHAIYGHTAIRCRDFQDGSDWVFNYGTFNFAAPLFALRFVFGLTDYELGVLPFRYFYKEYASHNCHVREQVLNLSVREKERLLVALDANYLPENRVYRYNIFHSNCTTRARDIIEQCVDGRIAYPEATADDHGESFRSMVRRYTAPYPWSAFGDDLCLGALADRPTTQRERHFLPRDLETDFENAYIYNKEGGRRVLVASSGDIIKAQPTTPGSTFFTPMLVCLLLLALSAGIAWLEWRRGKTFKLWDIGLMACQGIVGIGLTILFFSLHPTTSTNCQLLLFNPLPLCFIAKVWRRTAKRYWQTMGALLLLFLLCGIVWQSYNAAMYVLAACIAIRVAANMAMPNSVNS